MTFVVLEIRGRLQSKAAKPSGKRPEVERPNMDAGKPINNGEVAADESCFVETARFRVCPREGQYGIQVPLGAWHSVVVHERSTILEAKDGAYGK